MCQIATGAAQVITKNLIHLFDISFLITSPIPSMYFYAAPITMRDKSYDPLL